MGWRCDWFRQGGTRSWSCSASTQYPRSDLDIPVWGFAYPDSRETMDLRETWLFDTQRLSDWSWVFHTTSPTAASDWTASPPGCDPTEDGACEGVTAWTDAHGIREGDKAVVWATGLDAHPLAYEEDLGEGWEFRTVPLSATGGLRDAQWTSVYVYDEHVFLVGVYQCLTEACPDGQLHSALLLIHYDRRRREYTDLVVLDMQSCDGSDGICDNGFPIASARVNGVWGDVEVSGELSLFIIGSWPAFERGEVQDVRALLYNVTLAL